MSHTDIKQVEKFWTNHPCGSDTSKAKERRRYFLEIERYRYNHIRYILKDAIFREFKSKKVLEIGCGVGTDGLQFARHGAVYTGINLDEGSTKLAREAFELFEMSGEIIKMNGEEMTFQDNTFDHIYSNGVLHHTPKPEKIVAEMFRVLKPGGTFYVMVYNKSSINYYLEIMFLRKLFLCFLRPTFAPRFIAGLTGFDEYKLQRHREIMLSEHMTPERWLSINTDGPDNPLSQVYTGQAAIKLFTRAGFAKINTYARFFDKTHYSFIGKLIPDSLADMIGNRWGWNRIVKGVKPLANKPKGIS